MDDNADFTPDSARAFLRDHPQISISIAAGLLINIDPAEIHNIPKHLQKQLLNIMESLYRHIRSRNLKTTGELGSREEFTDIKEFFRFAVDEGYELSLNLCNEAEKKFHCKLEEIGRPHNQENIQLSAKKHEEYIELLQTKGNLTFILETILWVQKNPNKNNKKSVDKYITENYPSSDEPIPLSRLKSLSYIIRNFNKYE